MRFERHWWAALDHDFTPHGFCEDDTYDRLPPLPVHLFGGDLGWLDAEAAGPDAYYMTPHPVPRAALELLDRRLAGSGVRLPASFMTFMGSAELQRRVPSATSNGWWLSDPEPSPAEKYGFLLRFMHDQQGCYYFYLYLAEDGSAPVLGSESLFTPGDQEDEDDGEAPLTSSEFVEYAQWLAPDFEQFLYRYWVENVIWHRTVYQEGPAAELPPLARDYLRLLQDPDRPDLNQRPAPLSPWADHPNQLRLW